MAGELERGLKVTAFRFEPCQGGITWEQEHEVSELQRWAIKDALKAFWDSDGSQQNLYLN